VLYAAAAVAQRRRAEATVTGTVARPLTVAIAGAGRDRERLERLASLVARESGRRATPDGPETHLTVRFFGRLPDEELRALHRSGDVFAMLCRNRWGGLEQEGFGIVFVEAAASGTPQVAGRSGGSHEAVDHDTTGLVVDPRSVKDAADALRAILDDDARRQRFAAASRRSCEQGRSYDDLAAELSSTLTAVEEAVRRR
jgi:phosphatidyl-myo-inositol dimannoside synthase